MSMSNTEKHVKDIRRKTRRKFSSEEKIRIVLDGLRMAKVFRLIISRCSSIWSPPP
jgi:transposase-like protein